MRTSLKLFHILALAVFVGSIFGHILLGVLAKPLAPEAQAVLMAAKRDSAYYLTLPGLILTIATGVALALTGGLTRARWLGLKVALVALIGVNGGLMLAPLGGRIADAAAAGSPLVAEMSRQESLFGAANAAMVVVVLALALFRPRLG